MFRFCVLAFLCLASVSQAIDEDDTPLHSEVKVVDLTADDDHAEDLPVRSGKNKVSTPAYGKVEAGWEKPVSDTVPRVTRVDLGGEQDAFHETKDKEAREAMEAAGELKNQLEKAMMGGVGDASIEYIGSSDAGSSGARKRSKVTESAEDVESDESLSSELSSSSSGASENPEEARKKEESNAAEESVFDDEAITLPEVTRNVSFQAKTPADAFPCGTSFSPDFVTISVVEHHHHVLRPILSAAACKVLPSQGVELVHVDTHSDFLAPPSPDISTSLPKKPFDVETLIDQVTIGSFLMPLWAMSLVTKTVWIRSTFETGIYNSPSAFGDYDFSAGKASFQNSENGSLSYYLCASGSVQEGDCLNAIDPVSLSLTVTDMESYLSLPPKPTKRDNEGEREEEREREREGKDRRDVKDVEGDWVLDIDLDYFASDEPVMRALHRLGFRYREASLIRESVQGVQEVLLKNSLSLIDIDTQGRKSRIRSIVNLMANMIEHHLGGTGVSRKRVQKLLYPKKPLSLFGEHKREGERALDRLAQVCDSIDLSRANRKRVKSELKHRMGEFLDNLLLPEPSHTGTLEEVKERASLLEKMIVMAPSPPKLVVISRSVRDGYTPYELWSETEWAVIASVQRGLKKRKMSSIMEYAPGIRVCPTPKGCTKPNPADCF